MNTTTPSVNEILDAAAAIIIGDGVAALGYGTLAERLDTTPAAVAEAFPLFEELLVAILARATGELVRAAVDDIDRDPRGGLPSRIFGYAIHAVYENPLARALYLTDPEGLNRMMRAVDGLVAVPELSIHPGLLPALQEVGMARADIDPHAIAAVISALGAGVAMTAPGQALDAVSRGLTTMLERTVDAEVTDTAPGKVAFARYTEALVPSCGSAR